MATLEGSLATMFSRDGWTDARELLSTEAAKLKPWTFLTHPEIREEDVLAAPEVMDPKTDAGSLPCLPLVELLRQKKAARAAELADAEAIDVMDTLSAYEAMVFRCEPLIATLFSNIWLHDLTLTEGHAALRAFTRSIMKQIDLTVQAVAQADVRDGDEEFMTFTFDLDPLTDVAPEEILSELDAAIAGTTNEAIKTRLRVRRALLEVVAAARGINQRKEPPTEGSGDAAGAQLETLAKAASSAVAAWTRDGADELTPNSKVFRSDAPLWLSAGSPQPVQAPIKFSEAHAVYVRLFEDLVVIAKWRHAVQGGFYAVLNAVKSFSLSGATLLSRSLGMLFLYNSTTGVIAGVRVMHSLILDTLAKDHGAPYYRGVFDKKQEFLGPIVAMQVEHLSRRNPVSADAVQTEIVDVVSRWVMDVARTCLYLLHALLHTRARCHRRLVELMPSVTTLQQQSFSNDTSLFARQTQPQHMTAAFKELAMRSTVMTAFVSELIFEAIDIVFNVHIELKLLSTQEFLAFLTHRHFLATLRAENYNSLYITADRLNVVTAGANKKQAVAAHGPSIGFRVPAAVPVAVMAVNECIRGHANASFIALAVVRDVVASLKAPPMALQTTEAVFDNRFFPLASIVRPKFVSYRQAMRQAADVCRDPIAALDQAGKLLSAMLAQLKGVSIVNADIDAARRLAVENGLFIAMMKKALEEKGTKDVSEALSAYKVGCEFSTSTCMMRLTAATA